MILKFTLNTLNMDIYDIALYVGYFLIVIGAVAAVLLPLIQSMGDPKSLLKTGLAIKRASQIKPFSKRPISTEP